VLDTELAGSERSPDQVGKRTAVAARGEGPWKKIAVVTEIGKMGLFFAVVGPTYGVTHGQNKSNSLI
jgi:hypothetical protein